MKTTNQTAPARLARHTPVRMLDGTAGKAYASPQCGIGSGPWDGVSYIIHQENPTTGGWRKETGFRQGVHFEVL